MQSYRVYSAPSTRTAVRRAAATTTAPYSTTSRNMAFCSPFGGYRVARRSVPVSHFYPSASSSGSIPSVFQADFSPFLRMFDELENLTSTASRQAGSAKQEKPWQPRFDVREEGDAFHLSGDLPGVDQKDLSIEFTDANTLAIRGKTVCEKTSGTPPQATVQAAEEAKAIESEKTADNDTAMTEPERAVSPVSESGSNYQRPSVDEEQDEEWTEAVPTPATTATEVAKSAEPQDLPKPSQETEQAQQQQQAEQDAAQQQQQQQQQSGRYWVSERSVGTFQRSFKFPGLIDQDAVTANLKNGVLSVVVPKQQPKQPKKITIA